MREFYFNKERILFYIAVTLSVIFLVGAFYYLNSTRKYVREVESKTIEVSYDPFRNLTVSAKSAYVLDTKSGEVLYSKNPNEKLPLASITKVMTSLVAMENIPATETITIQPSDLYTDGESGLIPYEVWESRDLIDFTLIVSSNDGAEALRRSGNQYTLNKNSKSFIETMNSRAREIGMTESSFGNPTGLDVNANLAGAYSSSKDVATLFDFLLSHYPFLIRESAVEEEVFTSYSGLNHVARNTNLLTGTIPDLIASKTGFTDLAGGNLAVIVEPENGRPVIIVVLGSTRDGRFADVSTLYSGSKLYLSAEKKIAEFEREIEELGASIL